VLTFADYDMVFLDDEKEKDPSTFQFFQAAQKWAQEHQKEGGVLSYDIDDSDDSDDDDEEEAADADGADGDKAKGMDVDGDEEE
jgi:crooked neck